MFRLFFAFNMLVDEHTDQSDAASDAECYQAHQIFALPEGTADIGGGQDGGDPGKRGDQQIPGGIDPGQRHQVGQQILRGSRNKEQKEYRPFQLVFILEQPVIFDLLLRHKVSHQRSAEFPHQQEHYGSADDDTQQTVQGAGDGTEQHAPQQFNWLARHKGNDHMKHMQQNVDHRGKGSVGLHPLLHDDPAVIGGKLSDPG